jgi:hypothetical protein
MYKKIAAVVYIVILYCQIAMAAGLSTTFGEVRVDNIGIGQMFSMERDANTPLVIRNTSDADLVINIDIIMPNEQSLDEGYWAIPDTNWIAVERKSFVIPPESEMSTDITITIPFEDRFRGKKYQVFVWSHTVGETLGVGLRSKLLITIAE